MKDHKEIIDRHLDAWRQTFNAPSSPNLGDVVQAIVTECLAEDDTIWVPLVKHNEAVRALESSRDNLQAIVRRVAELTQRDQSKETVVGAVERLLASLAAMTQARDDAVEAAHIGQTEEKISERMTLEELTDFLRARFGEDFTVTTTENTSFGTSDNVLKVNGEVRATWKSRLVNPDIPRDGVTPRGPSEYYDVVLHPTP